MSKIRQSAKGEDCQIRIPGVCNFDPATTVWAHASGSAAGKGIGMKAPDILGAYACYACHCAVDGATKIPRHEVRLHFWEGHARSVLKLIEKGLI